MTGSDSLPCPNCGKMADYSFNTRNPMSQSLYCNHCGLSIQPVLKFDNLCELNDARQQQFPKLRELKKLPKQNKECF